LATNGATPKLNSSLQIIPKKTTACEKSQAAFGVVKIICKNANKFLMKYANLHIITSLRNNNGGAVKQSEFVRWLKANGVEFKDGKTTLVKYELIPINLKKTIKKEASNCYPLFLSFHSRYICLMTWIGDTNNILGPPYRMISRIFSRYVGP